MSSYEGKKPKKKKSGLLIALVIVFVILLVAVGVLGWYSIGLKAGKTFTENIMLVIPEKSTISEIGELLEEEGIIKSTTAFKIYTKLNKINNLQAGQYLIEKDMDLKEIITMFENGDIYTGDNIQFRYTEGKTIP